MCDFKTVQEYFLDIYSTDGDFDTYYLHSYHIIFSLESHSPLCNVTKNVRVYIHS